MNKSEHKEESSVSVFKQSESLTETLKKQFGQPEHLAANDFSHVRLGDREYFLPSYGRKGVDLPHKEPSPQILSYLEAILKGLMYNEPVVIFTQEGTMNDPFLTEARHLLHSLTGIASENKVIVDGFEFENLDQFIAKQGHYFMELKANKQSLSAVKPTMIIRHADKLHRDIRMWISVCLEQNRIGNKHLRPNGLSPVVLMLVPLDKREKFNFRNIPLDQNSKYQFAYAHERTMITPVVDMALVPKTLQILSKRAETTVPMKEARATEYMNIFFDIPDAVEEVLRKTKKSFLSRVFGGDPANLQSRSLFALTQDVVAQGSMRITPESVDEVAKNAPEGLSEIDAKKWAVHRILLEVVQDATHHPKKELQKPYQQTGESMVSLLNGVKEFSSQQDILFEEKITTLTGKKMPYYNSEIGIHLRDKMENPLTREVLEYLAHRGQYEQVAAAIRGKNNETASYFRSMLLRIDPELYYESLIGVDDVNVRLKAAASAIKTAMDLYQENVNLTSKSVEEQKPTRKKLEEAIGNELSENPKFIALIVRGLQLLRDFPKEGDNSDTITIRNKAFEFFSKLQVEGESLLDMEGIEEDDEEFAIAGFRHSFLLKMSPVLSSYVSDMLEAESSDERRHWLSWKPFFEQEFVKFRQENFKHFSEEDIQILHKVYEAQFMLMTLLGYSMVGDKSRQVELFKQGLIQPLQESVLAVESPVPEMVNREGVHKVIKVFAPMSLTFNVYNSFQRSLDIILMLSDTHLSTEGSKQRREQYLATYQNSDSMIRTLLYSVQKTEEHLRFTDREASMPFFKLKYQLKRSLEKKA